MLFNSINKEYSIKFLVIISLFLTCVGIIVLYSALYAQIQTNLHLLYKQILYFALGWCIFALVSRVDYHIFHKNIWFMYSVTLLLLMLVVFYGKTQMGAQRWINFGGFNFQPSELAKVTTVIVSAYFLQYVSYHNSVGIGGFLKYFFLPFLPIGLLAVLIFIQPDLGTASVLIMIFFSMSFFLGVRAKFLFICFGFGVGIIPFFWHFLKEYQKNRLIVFLNPDIDPLGIGYTIIQSKIAIGSGGLLGKGFLFGTQSQLRFIPERHTDFIFTVIAEEFGFIGSLLLFFLFYFLLFIILRITFFRSDNFARSLGIGIFCFFFSQIFVNLLMVMGFLPIVGLPLPFVSYGGSHIFMDFFLLGVVASIDKYAPVDRYRK